MSGNVTVIVGAGAVLDFDHNGIYPTINNITNEVLKLIIPTVKGGERPLIKELHDYIVKRLKLVGNTEVRRHIHPQLNFERLLHVIEMCSTYSSCWHDECQYWENFPIFGALIEPNSFLADIETIEYKRAAYALQENVMEIINQYDSIFSENRSTESWYRKFWQSFLAANIFTLNYDSTIEVSLGEYEDGFENVSNMDEFSRFVATKYYDNPNGLVSIAHLHGSILYSESKSFPFEYSIRDMVKNKDYDIAKRNRIVFQSAPCYQSGEEYIQPYIISGTRKIEKMVCTPYNVYLSDLTRKVLQNERLMIIGYSFGDLYLNEILGLGIAAHGDDFKVVIIDKYPPYINDYPSLYHKIINSNQYNFISRLVRDGLHINPFHKEQSLIVKDYNTPVISRNGNLMMCMTGFKDVVINHRDDVMNFLS